MASVKTGSWMGIFWVMIACNVVAAFMALFWLKPLAVRTIAGSELLASPGLHEVEPRAAKGVA
jgi:hypothetical protein